MKSFLKHINKNMPTCILRIIGPLVRRKLIKNSDFLHQYNICQLGMSQDTHEMDAFRLNSINVILEYAKKYVPFYKNNPLYPSKVETLEEYSTLPILTRKDLLENKICSEEKMKYYNGQTGGTTGLPLDLYLSMESIYREKAFIYSFWSKFGYDFNTSKLITFRGVYYDGRFAQYNPLNNEYIVNPFILNSETFYKYIKLIKTYKPDFLHGYPSSIYTFAKLYARNKCNYKFKGVFFISEEVSDNIKKEIEDLLQTKCYSFYGHSERAVFAEEYNDNYVFNDLYSYVELVDGTIVTTGYINKKMPLIRYNTEDEVKVINRNTRIKGKRKGDEFIFNKYGEQISIMNASTNGEECEHVLAFQIVQDKIGEIIYIIESDLGTTRLTKYEQLIHTLLGPGFVIKFIYKKVERTTSGKLISLKQNIKNVPQD